MGSENEEKEIWKQGNQTSVSGLLNSDNGNVQHELFWTDVFCGGAEGHGEPTGFSWQEQGTWLCDISTTEKVMKTIYKLKATV